MLSRILTTSYDLVRLVFVGALTYGTIVPAYRLAEGLEDLHQLAQSAHWEAEARTDEYHGQRFDGIVRWANGKEREGEQAAIRRLRRNIEDTMGIDCDTINEGSYELPTVELGKQGFYELRMQCRTREAVISFPRTAVELRVREE